MTPERKVLDPRAKAYPSGPEGSVAARAQVENMRTQVGAFLGPDRLERLAKTLLMYSAPGVRFSAQSNHDLATSAGLLVGLKAMWERVTDKHVQFLEHMLEDNLADLFELREDVSKWETFRDLIASVSEQGGWDEFYKDEGYPTISGMLSVAALSDRSASYLGAGDARGDTGPSSPALSPFAEYLSQQRKLLNMEVSMSASSRENKHMDVQTGQLRFELTEPDSKHGRFLVNELGLNSTEKVKKRFPTYSRSQLQFATSFRCKQSESLEDCVARMASRAKEV